MYNKNNVNKYILAGKNLNDTDLKKSNLQICLFMY